MPTLAIAVCRWNGCEDTAVLRIEGDIPERPHGPNWERQAQEFYRSQAELVDQALMLLPQGTRHQLLILFLQRHADLYSGKAWR